MCAIVDANVAHEMFGSDPAHAGPRFRRWIDSGAGRLVLGGRLLQEIDRTPAGREWARDRILAGLIRIVDERLVDERTDALRRERTCRSNDPHVVALAQVSGARLLYSNDRTLQEDFRDRRLLDRPSGKVYTTLESRRFRPGHETNQRFRPNHDKLLKRKDLCTARGGPVREPAPRRLVDE